MKSWKTEELKSDSDTLYTFLLNNDSGAAHATGPCRDNHGDSWPWHRAREGCQFPKPTWPGS